MPDLQSLLDRAGFRPRGPAADSAIAELESALDIRLPAEIVQLWRHSDGMEADGMELLPVASAQRFTFAEGFCYVPFAYCQDSNPYAIACREPLVGTVIHICHDDDWSLLCRGLARFLELVGDARQRGEGMDQIAGDFDFAAPDRSAEDAALAREVMRAAEAMDREDYQRTTALRFAAQLLGRGHEDDLAAVLTLGDEYTRAAVRERWTALDTPLARERLGEDTAAFQAFIAELQRAFETAGAPTIPERDGTFRLQKGNAGLNFPVIYADCRRGGTMDDWVRRFTGRR
jgi:hypothetical protein